MKKVIAIMLVFAMCFSLFGCKTQNDDEDTAKPLEILQNEAENQTENKNENPQPEPEKEPEPDIDMETPFREGEVVVTLTKEQSAKKLKYTPEYFKSIDAFNVFEFDYFPEEYHPEYKGMTTLIVMFNSPSKENVIEAIKTLKKDERVYDAVPNYMMAADTWYYAVLTTEETEKNLEYTEGDFSNCQVTKLYNKDVDWTEFSGWYKIDIRRAIKIRIENNQDINIKKLVSDIRVDYIAPIYNNINIEDLHVTANPKQDILEKYVPEDFEGISCDISYYDALSIPGVKDYFLLTFKNASYYEAYRVHHLLEEDDRIQRVSFNWRFVLIDT